MGISDIESLWAASDYAPTAERLAPVAPVVAERLQQAIPPEAGPGVVADIGAGHGHLSALLVDRGMTVYAIEPTSAMRSTGQESVPQAMWSGATAEDTGLGSESVDAIASAFGWMFGDPALAVPEAARILRPHGALVFTAWAPSGFLHDMTQRMFAAVGMAPQGPHLGWGDENTCRERLSDHFGDVQVERASLPWNFDSVESGMRLYREGSPTHAMSFARAGNRAPDMLAALEHHLRDCADPATGRIDNSTDYLLITARQPRTSP